MSERKSYPQKIIFFFFPFVFCASTLIVGCKSSPPQSSGSSKIGRRALPTGVPSEKGARIVDSIAALVNQDPIMASDVDEKTEALYGSQPSLPKRDTEEGKRKYQELFKQVLDRMVNEKLIAQQAQNPQYKGLIKACSDEVLQNAIEVMKQKNNIGSDAEFVQALQSQGMTYASYKKLLCSQIIQEQIFTAAIGSRIQVSDEEVKTYYDKMLQGTNNERTEVHLFDILLPIDKGASSDEIRKVSAVAIAMKKKIQQGQEITAVAREFVSQGVAPDRDIDLGFLAIKDLPDELKEDILLAQKNEIRGPIQAGKGLHLIKWTDRRNEEIKPFEEAKLGIKMQLYGARKEAAIEAFIKELRRKNYIDIRV